jgi:hypothetical protein
VNPIDEVAQHREPLGGLNAAPKSAQQSREERGERMSTREEFGRRNSGPGSRDHQGHSVVVAESVVQLLGGIAWSLAKKFLRIENVHSSEPLAHLSRRALVHRQFESILCDAPSTIIVVEASIQQARKWNRSRSGLNSGLKAVSAGAAGLQSPSVSVCISPRPS